MAAYRVLQDIEAEDKLVGPMTARQLLYAGVASAFLFVGYLVGDKVGWWIMAIFFVPALPFICLAAPLKHEQPNDIWLLARLNYLLRPRKRTWQQTTGGRKVVIKRRHNQVARPIVDQEAATIDNRLKDLADTLDSQNNVTLPSLGQPLIDPYLSEEHPVASRFDNLLNNQSAQAWSPAQTQAQPALSDSQAAAINRLAGADDLKVATIASLAEQPTRTANAVPPNL